jgi:hypothetical protein
MNSAANKTPTIRPESADLYDAYTKRGSVSLGGFDALVETLGRAKLVKRDGDLLRWIGPRVAA